MCLTSLHTIQQDLIKFIPFFLVDADDFRLAFETNCTKFPHALFPRERDLCTHESNGNVRTYENQAYSSVIQETPVNQTLDLVGPALVSSCHTKIIPSA